MLKGFLDLYGISPAYGMGFGIGYGVYGIPMLNGMFDTTGYATFSISVGNNRYGPVYTVAQQYIVNHNVNDGESYGNAGWNTYSYDTAILNVVRSFSPSSITTSYSLDTYHGNGGNYYGPGYLVSYGQGSHHHEDAVRVDSIGFTLIASSQGDDSFNFLHSEFAAPDGLHVYDTNSNSSAASSDVLLANQAGIVTMHNDSFSYGINTVQQDGNHVQAHNESFSVSNTVTDALVFNQRFCAVSPFDTLKVGDKASVVMVRGENSPSIAPDDDITDFGPPMIPHPAYELHI